MGKTQATGKNIADHSLDIELETFGTVPITRGGTGATTMVAARAALGANLYAIPLAFAGKPTANQVSLPFITPYAFRLPAGLTSSQATAGTAFTTACTFSLRRNGVQVGTVTWSASNVVTFDMTNDTDFAVGSVTTAVAPATPPTTGANIVIVLAGVLI